MTLDELQQLCAASASADWNLIESVEDALGHRSRAIYKPDLLIELRWGAEWQETFSEPWHRRFADESASGRYLDFFYGGTLVAREHYVSVDGARYMIPLPAEHGTVPDREDRGYSVTRWQRDLFAVVMGLTSTYPLDDALERAGIVVSDG